METDVGQFSPGQNQAVLAVSLTCGFISFAMAAYTMRWFLLMKRNFRHQVILLLILSDEIKAFWYFIFPIVHFANPGEVETSSNFCQASGWLLQCATESSDFALLFLAIHTMLYIFVPRRENGEGGLYPYRHWLYPVWVTIPAVMASLAFIQGREAYVANGILCQLPKRPFWYRLGLSWIPRYVIFALIFIMYGSIYAYVHYKFHGFNNVGTNLTSDTYGTTRLERTRRSFQATLTRRHSGEGLTSSRHNSTLSTHHHHDPEAGFGTPSQSAEPWDSVNFITSKPLHNPDGSRLADIAEEPQQRTADAAPLHNSYPATDGLTHAFENDPSPAAGEHTSSGVPILRSALGGIRSSILYNRAIRGRASGASTEIQRTRSAILRQLRLLFLYPLVYFLMWIFPLISHILNYDDFYVENPPFWLAIMTTIMLSLQAGADAAIFMAMEKPWRRVEPGAKLVPKLHRLLEPLNQKWQCWRNGESATAPKGGPNTRMKNSSQQGQGTNTTSPDGGPLHKSKTRQWWESAMSSSDSVAEPSSAESHDSGEKPIPSPHDSS